jgi:hypothetical protein
MDPRDFLQIAKNLLKIDKPANCRTVFNRSYYAAYNVGVCFLEGLEGADIRISKGPGGHGEVSRYFHYSGMQDLKEAHQKLVNLYSDRINADYRLSDEKAERFSNARKAVGVAEDIIKTLDSHSSNSDRKKIGEEIKRYLKKISS